MEQKFNEAKDNREEDDKVIEDNSTKDNKKSPNLYRNTESPTIVQTIPPDKTNLTEHPQPFPNIIHYNAATPTHHTFKTPVQAPYNYPYFVATTTDDNEQNKYDTNFNQYPAISQFQSLTNVISIPMTAASHGTIAQKNLKIFGKIPNMEHSSAPTSDVDPNSTTNNGTIPTNFPPPIYNNYTMNFIDNSTIINPDKNGFIRRS